MDAHEELRHLRAEIASLRDKLRQARTVRTPLSKPELLVAFRWIAIAERSGHTPETCRCADCCNAREVLLGEGSC